MHRRRWLQLSGAAGALALGGGAWWSRASRFPPDTTPEGAYLRVSLGLGRGDARGIFAYLEEAAQHACFTLHDYRRRSSALIASRYPEPERSRLLAAYRAVAEAKDAIDVFMDEANRRGWIARLRRDLSGIAAVEIGGERATVVTARGTRYPFRRRPNGIWGLTLFTAELTTEAERAARDHDVVERAAADYARGERAGPQAAPSAPRP